jgi:endonuclease/exonuclease/phosphatase family metal-dependent hydrolase
MTFTPQNPNSADPNWPFRGIDHVLIRCDSAGPSLPIRGRRRIFDHGQASASDHYRLVVEFGPS